jgi:DNA invertase Pin-like site-specific DNA recombinase
MIIGYCRAGLLSGASVLKSQSQELSEIGAERIFQDDARLPWRRHGLESAISQAKAGDIVIVRWAHHLAWTSRGVVQVVKKLAAKGVGLRILNTPLDTSTTTGRMVLASTPLWSLNVSPLQSLFADFALRLGRR